eukprot:COSAG04_NODE_394_length_15124_cov_10.557005_4_plen_341_part_00
MGIISQILQLRLQSRSIPATPPKMAPRRSRRLALKRITIGDLPEPALRRILLGPSDNLLRFVAACARVCAEWRRVVGGSAAYGLGLPRGRRTFRPMFCGPGSGRVKYDGDDGERARVLKAVANALEKEGGHVDLNCSHISDAGAAALGAALQAMPRIRFTTLWLEYNELTAAGAAFLAPALRRPWGDGGGLKELSVRDNPLGDAEVAALAKALPPSLEDLRLNDMSCGDDGLVALVAALPTLTRLISLWCNRNPDATARGWVALAGALPSAPALEMLYLFQNPGLGSEGAAALVGAVPNCLRLRVLDVDHCALDERSAGALRARRDDDPAGELSVAAEQI